MFGIGTHEILIFAIIAILLFGSAKIPQLARSLGQSIKEFKRGTLEEDPIDDKIEDTKVIANEVISKEVSDSPLSVVPDKYELAMVSTWWPKVTPKPKLGTHFDDSVQDGSVPTDNDSTQAPSP